MRITKPTSPKHLETWKARQDVRAHSCPPFGLLLFRICSDKDATIARPFDRNSCATEIAVESGDVDVEGVVRRVIAVAAAGRAAAGARYLPRAALVGL